MAGGWSVRGADPSSTSEAAEPSATGSGQGGNDNPPDGGGVDEG